MITKKLILRPILVYFSSVSSKLDFFNHGKGKDNEFRQIKDNLRASSKVIFENFSSTMVKTRITKLVEWKTISVHLQR